MRGALPPGPRDLTLWGQDVQGGGNPETGFPPHPGTEVALRSLPSVALSSTQVENSQVENSLPNPDHLCHPSILNLPISTLKTHLLSCLANGVHLTNPHIVGHCPQTETPKVRRRGKA